MMMIPHPEEPVEIPGPSTADIHAIIQEVLEENAFVQDGDVFDPAITFQELNMDSLDITRFVIEVGSRFGIVVDTETVWPTNMAELIRGIEHQLTL